MWVKYSNLVEFMQEILPQTLLGFTIWRLDPNLYVYRVVVCKMTLKMMERNRAKSFSVNLSCEMGIIKLNYLSFTNHYQSFDFMQQHKQCTDYIYHAFIVE